MVTNETKKICKVAESDIKDIIKEAIETYKKQIDAMDAAEEAAAFFNRWGGGTSASSLRSGAKEELDKYVRNFTSRTQATIKPLVDKLSKLTTTCEYLDDITYLVDSLESLAQKAEPLDCSVPRYSINITKCRDCIVEAAKKWRKKITDDPTIRKKILNNQLIINQDGLAKMQKEYEDNKNNIAQCREKLENILNDYNGYVTKVIFDSTKEYENKLTKIEKLQKEQISKGALKMDKADLFVRASVFNKKKREDEYRIAEEEYKKVSFELNQEIQALNNWASIDFASKYNQIDASIRKLLEDIEDLTQKIKANETGIISYKNAIEGIKGELNG